MARILIIDDEPPIRTLLRLALESVGHEVVEAQDGRIGLTLYRQNPTDLIITEETLEAMKIDNPYELTWPTSSSSVISPVVAHSSRMGRR